VRTRRWKERTDDTGTGHRRLARLVRRIAHPARRQPVRAAGRGRDFVGEKWRRPHDYPARHHGPDGRAQRRHSRPWVEAIRLPTHRIAHLGIGYCPEERGIFSSLSTEENLMLPPRLAGHESGMSVAEIYRMFPNLYERRHSPGTRLSGGEQQMLAVARILRTGARLLLLDEISEGLAPVIVQALARMIRTLREKGYTIVMVEQNFRFAAPLADRFYVMEHGRIVKTIAAGELRTSMPELTELLGV